ncbi:hypothetical protein D3C86_1232540 [compost metagenome]
MFRHHDTTYGSTFLSCFGRDLSCDLFNEDIELRHVSGHICTQYRTVQRVGLHIERNGLIDQARMRFQHFTGSSRTRKGYRISVLYMIQDTSGRTTDQLQRTIRQDTGCNNIFYDCLGKEGSYCSGFHNRRNTSHQVNRNFLQHTPYREVECIDMDGYATLRYHNVMTNEGTTFGKRRYITIYIKRFVRKLAAEGSISKQVTNTTFNIYPAIGTGSTGKGRYFIIAFFTIQQVQGQCLQHSAALMKGHFSQGRTTYFTCIIHHGTKIQLFTVCYKQCIAGNGII